jgi:hypothetical protein
MKMNEIPELAPNIITTLIEKIVDDISDSEINELIAFFRKERIATIQAEATGKKQKKPNLDKEAAKAQIQKISLDELELE